MQNLIEEKVCGCGRKHAEIPATARFLFDSELGGAYFECACGSTLFVPLLKILFLEVGEAA